MTVPGARATLADVARAAGVSTPTVSKALNNRPEVSEETRRRVEEAVSRLGYAPRGGRPRRAGLVDLLLGAVDSPWAQEVVTGAEDEAARSGTGLVVTASRGDEVRAEWLRQLLRRRSDGVVLAVTDLATETVDALLGTGVPVVVLDRTGNSDPRLPSVGATNWAGALAATEHLIGQGHTRIGMISGLPNLACSAERVDGYLAALRRAGLPVDERLVVPGDYRTSGGRTGAATLLDLEDPPTAVFAGSDLQAFGVLDEARARGLRLPEDLSVVGFDDLSVAAYVTPALTTVRQPHVEMAAQAVRMALDPTSSRESPARVELSTELVVRASTCPPGPR